jgi:TPR repeat protein
VEKDYAKAVLWYRKAASQGHASAQNNLGYKYQAGQGVDKDDAQAIAWLRKAAEQGSPAAKASLKRLEPSIWQRLLKLF